MRKGCEKMAKKKVKWLGFVSVTLNKQEKRRAKEKQVSDERIHKFIIEAAQLGYKLSVAYEADQNFFTVTLYGNIVDNPNAGYAMSIRHSDLLVCFSAFHYLFEETGLDADWSERWDTANAYDW